MSDKLVFDLAQEVEGSPNVFVRKEWVSILDNQNSNYNNNQSVIDTSALTNSNKYMSYREAYLSIPMLLTLEQKDVPVADRLFLPNTTACDYAVGLKNWFGQIIHSFTMDYNGTTIIQQTPFINMWNSFRLMTSLSYGDIITQGATIGFYPDDSTSWTWSKAPVPVGGVFQYPYLAEFGQGIANSGNSSLSGTIATGIADSFTSFNALTGNEGFLRRQTYINYDAEISDIVPVTPNILAPVRYNQILTSAQAKALYKNYIIRKFDGVVAGRKGLLQIAVQATVYLKHIHSFFNACPLLKGVFMKLTMNLNNTTTEFECGFNAGSDPYIAASRVSNPIGGVSTAMIAPVAPGNGSQNLLPPLVGNPLAIIPDSVIKYKYNISVGAKCLDSTMLTGQNSGLGGDVATQIYLYVPTYAFNPVFEQAYLSSPVKNIVYTDVYQYQVENIGGKGSINFNNLLTNGIANIKSVLILPYFSSKGPSTPNAKYATEGETIILSENSGFLSGIPVFQSPFDTAGTGTTSPLTLIKNFNIQISGQNAIYNMQKYSFEQFNHQLLGVNAVNGGLTDGLTSGLIDQLDFEMAYTYYYVNVGRMLPSTMSVPKSVQITGTTCCEQNVDLFCFIEYEINTLKIDIQTGARVQ